MDSKTNSFDDDNDMQEDNNDVENILNVSMDSTGSKRGRP